jgi:CBS domain-containing protein
MLDGGFRHLPVMEGGTLVGVVSMRDLARSMAKG